MQWQKRNAQKFLHARAELLLCFFGILMMMMMMMMNFIHESMYLADANWGHNLKIK